VKCAQERARLLPPFYLPSPARMHVADARANFFHNPPAYQGTCITEVELWLALSRASAGQHPKLDKALDHHLGYGVVI